MPPRKQVPSLYKTCRTMVNSMIIESCRIFEEHYGSYDSPICRGALIGFQNFLLRNLPGHLLDELCGVAGNSAVGLPSNPQIIKDSRMFLKVYMHRNMRKLTSKVQLPADDSFWMKELTRLQKLTVLDLRMACTDEILEVIGKNCLLLEEINIVSRSESCEMGNNKPSINALKLKYYVSDNGLKQICNCKRLRRVTMNTMLKTQCAGRMMTENGIRELIKSLPKLIFISYTDVGSIVNTLVNEVEQLALTHINDFHCKASHIKAMSKLCPNLKELCLSQPVSSSGVDVVAADASINELALNKIKPAILELKFFPFTKSLCNFFELKGKYLTSLALLCVDPVTSKELVVIGKYCPAIENIHVKEVMSDPSDMENLRYAEKFPMMTSLKCLYLWGRDWSPRVIFTICVRNATKLKSLCMANNNHTELIDDLMLEVLRCNPLSELIHCFLFHGCFITYDVVYKIVLQCQNLYRLTVSKHDGLNQKAVIDLHSYLREQNMSIDISIHDTFYNPHEYY